MTPSPLARRSSAGSKRKGTPKRRVYSYSTHMSKKEEQHCVYRNCYLYLRGGIVVPIFWWHAAGPVIEPSAQEMRGTAAAAIPTHAAPNACFLQSLVVPLCASLCATQCRSERNNPVRTPLGWTAPRVGETGRVLRTQQSALMRVRHLPRQVNSWELCPHLICDVVDIRGCRHSHSAASRCRE